MTSTNVFTGVGGKSSSKVLKPPGGGHTDIFGAPEPPVRRDNGRNSSSIMEGTNTEKPTTPVKVAAPRPQMSAPAEETTSSRSKVPPGGFSSGPLW